jgi:hypothetical protein
LSNSGRIRYIYENIYSQIYGTDNMIAALEDRSAKASLEAKKTDYFIASSPAGAILEACKAGPQGP